jgi:uncharacterized protein YneF (UPF0154 family)
MPIWAQIVLPIITLLLGGVLGFVFARKWFKSYLKKNPPLNEKMIREMMRQMGATPSEKKVRQIMASMEQYQ